LRTLLGVPAHLGGEHHDHAVVVLVEDVGGHHHAVAGLDADLPVRADPAHQRTPNDATP